MKGKGKVVLAMSGGVDSSVSALLLKRAGYEVHGFFMTLRNSVSQGAQEPKEPQKVLDDCSSDGKQKWPTSIDWRKEERDVRAVCKKLGIKDLFILDCEEGYERKVISKMFDDYSRGLTPNPDILCNNVGKFPGLLKRAKAIGADFIATGHYARVRHRLGEYELLMGKDKKKDQSYFICGIGQEYLSRLIFPVGDLTKGEVRKIARRNGFVNSDKRSSRGICYLGKIDVKKFLHSRIKEKRGKVVSPSGEVVGTHPGQMFFTVGERVGNRNGFVLDEEYRGGVGGKKLFVARKLSGNKIMVAPSGSGILKTRRVFLKGFKFVGLEERKGLKGRIRHLGELHSGKLSRRGGRWSFNFNEGVEGIAEGQSLVLYKGERLVACGEIRLK
jgi:tRNA-uridine 2-sulfurtransferase